MKFRHVVVLASCLLGLTVAFLAWGYWSFQRVPDFYREAVRIEPARQQSANEALLQNAAALASNVRKEGRWQALFTAEQVNGWLAVDLKENYPDLLPDEVVEPRVKLSADGATIACRYVHGTVQTVLSLKVEPYMVEPNIVALRIKEVRAGNVPLPLTQVLDALTSAAENLELPIRWLQTDGDPVALVSIPPRHDEKTEYRLEVLELRQDELYVAGHTARIGAGTPVEEKKPAKVAQAPETATKR